MRNSIEHICFLLHLPLVVVGIVEVSIANLRTSGHSHVSGQISTLDLPQCRLWSVPGHLRSRNNPVRGYWCFPCMMVTLMCSCISNDMISIIDTVLDDTFKRQRYPVFPSNIKSQLINNLKVWVNFLVSINVILIYNHYRSRENQMHSFVGHSHSLLT